MQGHFKRFLLKSSTIAWYYETATFNAIGYLKTFCISK